MYATIPSHTSFRLCGAMFVAIPTAIPELPLTNKLGNFDGNTDGSFRLPSKFGTNFTVFLSMSCSISSAILCILLSVYLIAAALSPSTELCTKTPAARAKLCVLSIVRSYTSSCLFKNMISLTLWFILGAFAFIVSKRLFMSLLKNLFSAVSNFIIPAPLRELYVTLVFS